MSDHERLIAVTQKWDDEYKNLAMTARALLARAETAERANENYETQIAALHKALEWIHVHLGSECDWDELSEIEDSMEARWYRAVTKLLTPAAASALGREPGGDT